MREAIGRSFAQPDDARVEPKGGESFGQRDLGRLGDVEGAAHDGRDRREPVQLVLAIAVRLFEVVEVAAGHARCEAFNHVFDAALREREHLVAVRLTLQRLSDQLDGRAAVDRQDVDE